jgi:hypothetical protein
VNEPIVRKRHQYLFRDFGGLAPTYFLIPNKQQNPLTALPMLVYKEKMNWNCILSD